MTLEDSFKIRKPRTELILNTPSLENLWVYFIMLMAFFSTKTYEGANKKEDAWFFFPAIRERFPGINLLERALFFLAKIWTNHKNYP
jgi:hypothetical protein